MSKPSSLLLSGAASILLFSASPARADERAASAPAKWSVDVSGSGALILGNPQSNHFDVTGGGIGLGARYFPADWIGVELDLQYVGFEGQAGTRASSGYLAMGGLRFEPYQASWGTFYFGGDLGVADTGSAALFAFDGNVGLAFPIGPARLGPLLRFDDILYSPGANIIGGDARMLLLGARLEFGSFGQKSEPKPPSEAPPPAPVEVAKRPPSGPSTATIRGQLTNAKGEPLNGIVTITPEDGGPQKTLEANPSFDSRLAPGVYHIEAQATGYLAMGLQVTAKAGEPITENLSLRPIPSVRSANLTADQIEISQTILFEFRKARILEDSFPLLDEVVDVLLKTPDLRIQIEGHTDEVGTAEVNQELSEQRASAVRDYLIVHGVRANRMSAIGYGKTRPIASNATEAGRSRNRRVQFVIVKN